jgi:hypothetical protein
MQTAAEIADAYELRGRERERFLQAAATFLLCGGRRTRRERD